jgi:hypothetical protein
VSWRDCFRLQRIGSYGVVKVTPFGRAIKNHGRLGPAGTDAPDRYEMLYWLKLPVFEHRYRMEYDDYRMQQAVLVFHGHSGFKVHWLLKPTAAATAG